ncbi:TIGR00159 family protein [bacterium]|nr:MAG: TIGR00159 family protein [bacterium]
MQTGLFNYHSFFRALGSYPLWRVALEMLLIGVVVYWVVKFLEGTRGARLLRGVVVLLISLYLIVRLLSGAFNLQIITFLYDKLLLAASLAVVIVFQPELRRALMRVGESRFFRSMNKELDRDVDELVEAAVFCSKRKIGLLVAIEREVGLGGLTENATRLDAELSAPLLNAIFWPNSPLHDLGVVVISGRVAFAGVQFPLAESGELERELGSRHRAAVGMSQETDAVVLVVSEETGDISIAERGVLLRKLTPEAVHDMLGELLGRGEYRPSSPDTGGDGLEGREAA